MLIFLHHENNSHPPGGLIPFIPVAALKDYAGKGFGYSEWLIIDQEWADQFAECTGDHQFIYIDPEKAAKTSFGGTIAYGFLSLSLIPKLMEGLLVLPEGLKMAVNYGLDTVRFIQSVRAGLRVRLGLILLDVNEKNPGQWLIKAHTTLGIKGQERPVYVAETLSLCFV